MKEFKCLSWCFPILMREWDYVKNDEIDPLEITYGSAKKVWWICERGHEWKAVIKKRTLRGDGCPYCNGKRPISGENDFATLYPEIAKQWNFEENDTLPEEYLPVSNVKVSWRCEYGHVWVTSIATRTRGRGCPFCNHKMVLVGETDLVSTHPEIAKLWNYEKNKDTIPEQVSHGSHKKVWWRCANGHEWIDSVKNRVRISSCPYCSGRKVISGENDFGTKCSELQGEWSPRNKKSCFEYAVQSNQIVEWVCKKGHTWRAAIYTRSRGDKCPYCNGKKAIIGENDLKSRNPDLCKEWNYHKNGVKLPEDYTCYSNARVWWICEKGHEWKASIDHRSRGTGCPYCANRVSWFEV